MIVACPNCQSKYNLPEDKIAPTGSKVRCARCKNVFNVMPPAKDFDKELADLTASEPAAKPAPKPAPAPAPAPKPEAEAEAPKKMPWDDDEPAAGPADDDDLPGGGLAGGSGGARAKSPFDDDDDAPSAGAAAGGRSPFDDDEAPGAARSGGADSNLGGAGGAGGGEDDFLNSLGGGGASLDAPKKQGASKKKKLILIGVAALLLAAVGAGLFIFKPWTKFNIPFIGGGKKETVENVDKVKDIALRNVRQYYIPNEKAGSVFVVEGKAVNNFATPKERIKVEVSLFDEKGHVLLSKQMLCGNTLSQFQLQVQSEEEINASLGSEVGILTSNTYLKTGMDTPFMVVFFKPPDQVKEFGIKVIDAVDPK